MSSWAGSWGNSWGNNWGSIAPPIELEFPVDADQRFFVDPQSRIVQADGGSRVVVAAGGETTLSVDGESRLIEVG